MLHPRVPYGPFRGAIGYHIILVLLGVQIPTPNSQDKLQSLQIGIHSVNHAVTRYGL